MGDLLHYISVVGEGVADDDIVVDEGVLAQAVAKCLWDNGQQMREKAARCDTGHKQQGLMWERAPKLRSRG